MHLKQEDLFSVKEEVFEVKKIQPFINRTNT